VREGTPEDGLRASGFGARRRHALLKLLDQLRTSRDPISRAGRAQGALGERVGADEGRSSAGAAGTSRMASATTARRSPSRRRMASTASSASAPELAELVFGVAHSDARRAEDRDRRSEIAQRLEAQLEWSRSTSRQAVI
jgi:hypothetical protein